MRTGASCGLTINLLFRIFIQTLSAVNGINKFKIDSQIT